MQIADALNMIDKMQPGVTCGQLAEAIRNNPGGVQNVLNAYFATAGKK